ncbi:MAG: sugar ABC transporter permease [Anaerolineae bacterium]|nr:sugar ABC transporter permease [Anaerolineae bacterium]
MKLTYALQTTRTITRPFSVLPYRLTRHLNGYLFLLPAIIVFALVAWYPIVRAFQMSFQEVSLIGESKNVGFENYELMKKDPARKIIFENSIEFASWSILLGYAVPVVVAILVREMRFGKGFFRIVYFLPSVVPVSIAVIVWRFIYDPDAGVLNEFLELFGIKGQLWLYDPKLAKPSIVAVMTWGTFGTTTLIYLSSLLDIPTELYEAAELDGASPLMRIRHITLPHLFPIMSLLFVLQILAVVQVFTEPFLFTKGGPGRRETLTPVLHIYNRAFGRADMGYAAAWSVVLVIVLVAFSAFYQIVNRRIAARQEN